MVLMKKLLILSKKIVFIIILIYAIITFCNQQKILNTYAINKEELDKKITAAQDEQNELYKEKENSNSSEYIESIARDKLHMYLPNEKVYIESNN